MTEKKSLGACLNFVAAEVTRLSLSLGERVGVRASLPTELMRLGYALVVGFAIGLCLWTTPLRAADRLPRITTLSQPPSSALATNRLLIIAPNAFHPALKEFVAHKRAQLPTELRSLEDILSKNPGVDDPEKLKRFLYNEWRQHGLTRHRWNKHQSRYATANDRQAICDPSANFLPAFGREFLSHRTAP